jgi:hypothetical protein
LYTKMTNFILNNLWKSQFVIIENRMQQPKLKPNLN